MSEKVIKQRRFSRKLVEKLQNTGRPSLEQLDEKDIDLFIHIFWEEIGKQVKKGKQVMFETWISFFSKPVARRCRVVGKDESWMTYVERIRWKPYSRLREVSETELSKDEYEQKTGKK